MGHHTKNSTALEARRVRQRLAQINPSNSHSQRQSPLFSKIPPELRNQIFYLSVSQDLSRLTSVHSTCAPGIRTELLRTCRLIYYETNSIPMQSATIFCRKGFDGSTIAWFSRLTAKNVAEISHVYVYMGYGYLLLPAIAKLPQFRPEHVTLTIPQSSWKPLLLDQDVDDLVPFIPPDIGEGTLPESVESVTYEFAVHRQYVGRLRDKLQGYAFNAQSMSRRDGRILSTGLGLDATSCSPWEFPFWDPPHSHVEAPDMSVKVVFRLAAV